jgi:hypothetical protein
MNNRLLAGGDGVVDSLVLLTGNLGLGSQYDPTRGGGGWGAVRE